MPDNDLQIENRIYRLRISRYRRFLFLLLGAGVLAVLLTGYFLIWNRVYDYDESRSRSEAAVVCAGFG